MLSSTDSATSASLRLLKSTFDNRDVPVAFWIGSGVSSWCGYPRWDDLADTFHQAFARLESTYDVHLGQKVLQSEKYPELFQLCKQTNGRRYRQMLSTTFCPREPQPVYDRFRRALTQFDPLSILTTNVDEMLEKSLPQATVVSNSDLERTGDLLHTRTPYIAKLHGRIDRITSLVFTSDDYRELVQDKTYLHFLQSILSTTSVIFIGYSLRDNYVVSLLKETDHLSSLFGDGPHFAFTQQESTSLPPSVHIIRYSSAIHKDHRYPINLLEDVIRCRKEQPSISSAIGPEIELKSPEIRPPDESERAESNVHSAHMLSFVVPPGTWTTSQTITASTESGKKRQFIIGPGFTTEELPFGRSTAMHDLLVGLLCFDEVIAPLPTIGHIHNLIGSDWFWLLVNNDILKLVHWESSVSIVFSDPEDIAGGCLETFQLVTSNEGETEIATAIQRQIQPGVGKEIRGKSLIAGLEQKVLTISKDEEGGTIGHVHDLLTRPFIRSLIGMSDGTPANSIARWQVFPVLRLASIVRIGTACRLMNIGSVRLDFGFSEVAGPVFAALGNARQTADEICSYILCNRFSSIVGEDAVSDKAIFLSVIQFRESPLGEEIRSQVLSLLNADDASEVTVAINSALREGIPSRLLDAARDEFIKLLVLNQRAHAYPVAMWEDERHSKSSLKRWKMTSLKLLSEHCRRLGVKANDPCPCNSGERLKHCCIDALHD